MTVFKQSDSITDAEWEVMRVIWASKQTTSNEIIRVLKKKKEWKPSTVKTLLSRLVTKGYLITQKAGKHYIYQGTIDEDDALRESRKQFLGKMCQKKIGSTVIEIINENELSLIDIQTIKLLLNEKEKDAKQEVSCCCLPGQCRCKF